MKESLYDKYVDEHGFVDFGRSGGMSHPKEAKRFLSALNKLSELKEKDCFSISVIITNRHCYEIYSLLIWRNDIFITLIRKYSLWLIRLV